MQYEGRVTKSNMEFTQSSTKLNLTTFYYTAVCRKILGT